MADRHNEPQSQYHRERRTLMRKRSKLEKKLENYPRLPASARDNIKKQLEQIEIEIVQSHAEELKVNATGAAPRTMNKYRGANSGLAKRTKDALRNRVTPVNPRIAKSIPNTAWSRCTVCDVAFLSEQAYNVHLSGMLHKKNMVTINKRKALTGGQRSDNFDKNDDDGEWVGPTMEEQMEMEQHAMSRHHPDGPMGTMGGPNINTLANPSAAANLLNQLGLAPDSFNAAVIQQASAILQGAQGLQQPDQGQPWSNQGGGRNQSQGRSQNMGPGNQGQGHQHQGYQGRQHQGYQGQSQNMGPSNQGQGRQNQGHQELSQNVGPGNQGQGRQNQGYQGQGQKNQGQGRKNQGQGRKNQGQGRQNQGQGRQNQGQGRDMSQMAPDHGSNQEGFKHPNEVMGNQQRYNSNKGSGIVSNQNFQNINQNSITGHFECKLCKFTCVSQREWTAHEQSPLHIAITKTMTTLDSSQVQTKEQEANSLSGNDLSTAMKEKFDNHCAQMAELEDFKCDVCMMACHSNFSKEKRLGIWLRHMSGKQHATECDVQLAALGEDKFRAKHANLPVPRLFVKAEQARLSGGKSSSKPYSSRSGSSGTSSSGYNREKERYDRRHSGSDTYRPEEPSRDDFDSKPPLPSSERDPAAAVGSSIIKDPATAEDVNKLLGVVNKLKAEGTLSSLSQNPQLMKTIADATSLLANITQQNLVPAVSSQPEPLNKPRRTRKSRFDQPANEPLQSAYQQDSKFVKPKQSSGPTVKPLFSGQDIDVIRKTLVAEDSLAPDANWSSSSSTSRKRPSRFSDAEPSTGKQMKMDYSDDRKFDAGADRYGSSSRNEGSMENRRTSSFRDDFQGKPGQYPNDRNERADQSRGYEQGNRYDQHDGQRFNEQGRSSAQYEDTWDSRQSSGDKSTYDRNEGFDRPTDNRYDSRDNRSSSNISQRPEFRDDRRADYDSRYPQPSDQRDDNYNNSAGDRQKQNSNYGSRDQRSSGNQYQDNYNQGYSNRDRDRASGSHEGTSQSRRDVDQYGNRDDDYSRNFDGSSQQSSSNRRNYDDSQQGGGGDYIRDMQQERDVMNRGKRSTDRNEYPGNNEHDRNMPSAHTDRNCSNVNPRGGDMAQPLMNDSPVGGGMNTISMLNNLSVEDRQIVALLAKVCNDTDEYTLIKAVVDMRQRSPDLLRLFGTLLGLTVGASVGIQERQLVVQVVRQVFELVTNRDVSILQNQMQAVTSHIEQVVNAVRNAIALQQGQVGGRDNMVPAMGPDAGGHGGPNRQPGMYDDGHSRPGSDHGRMNRR